MYTPKSQRGLDRLDYRMTWDDDFRDHLNQLDEKTIILCGDLNVAHQEIDLANPSSKRKDSGFIDEERSKLTELLASGFIDSFRYFYPDKEDAYSWWSYMRKSRDRNVGWRLDYFVVSDKLEKEMEDSQIYSEILGSDHCSVVLEI